MADGKRQQLSVGAGRTKNDACCGIQPQQTRQVFVHISKAGLDAIPRAMATDGRSFRTK
jgi:hypothetical protein